MCIRDSTNHVAIIGISPSATVISNAIPASEPTTRRHVFYFDLLSHSRTSWCGNMKIVDNHATATDNFFSHHILVEGDNTPNRFLAITNVTFIKTNGVALNVESAYGVANNCRFWVSNNCIAIYGYGRTINGGTLGNGAWATNDNFGTDQFWYIENCQFAREFAYTTLDGYAGWRYVWRSNIATNCSVEGHGPELSAGRGTRASEVYMNTWWYTNTLSQVVTFQRSGVSLVWSNNIYGVSTNFVGAQPFKMVYYRQFEPISGWLDATGTNAFDLNQAGGPFGSGTVASTNFVDTLVASVSVSGTPWTLNQWRGYSIIRTNDTGPNGALHYSIVLSNSTSTLYYPIGQNGQLHFAAGDKFQFWKFNVALDQHGRGKGSLLTGTTPFPSGNDQELSPCYEWSNIQVTASQDMDWGPSYVCDTMYVLNTDYYNNTPKPGYTPLTYPHPILTGAGGGVTPHGFKPSRIVIRR